MQVHVGMRLVRARNGAPLSEQQLAEAWQLLNAKLNGDDFTLRDGVTVVVEAESVRVPALGGVVWQSNG